MCLKTNRTENSKTGGRRLGFTDGYGENFAGNSPGHLGHISAAGPIRILCVVFLFLPPEEPISESLLENCVIDQDPPGEKCFGVNSRGRIIYSQGGAVTSQQRPILVLLP